ncbi:hypothetical protein WR25_08522, partial [Diploscapter pachys]
QCLYEMMVGRGDPSQWTDCYCPLPCSNTDYKVSWSETILNKVPVECSYEGTTRPSGSPFDPTVAPITDTPTDYVKITISVRIDNNFVFSEKPKMSISNLFSYSGGVMGVIAGMSETNRENPTPTPSSFAVTSTDATMNGTVTDDDWFDNKDNTTIFNPNHEKLFIGIPLSQVPKNKHVTGVCLVIILILLCIFASCLDTQTCVIEKITRCCRKKKLRNAVAVPSAENDQKKLLKK